MNIEIQMYGLFKRISKNEPAESLDVVSFNAFEERHRPCSLTKATQRTPSKRRKKYRRRNAILADFAFDFEFI